VTYLTDPFVIMINIINASVVLAILVVAALVVRLAVAVARTSFMQSSLQIAIVPRERR
jgi:hypothetical protein